MSLRESWHVDLVVLQYEKRFNFARLRTPQLMNKMLAKSSFSFSNLQHTWQMFKRTQIGTKNGTLRKWRNFQMIFPPECLETYNYFIRKQARGCSIVYYTFYLSKKINIFTLVFVYIGKIRKTV